MSIKMFDATRRKLLITAATSAAAASLPRLAHVACYKSVPEQNDALELSLNQVNATAHTATIVNKTQMSVELKHVYPGVVHANGRIFDINSLLSRHPVMIKPGRSVSLSMNAMQSPITETPIPPDLTESMPISVTTLFVTELGMQRVTTLRSYFV